MVEEKNNDAKKLIKNTIMLYIISIVKLILPFFTLPYLTRVLSEESYGFVSYVKNCMVYIQLIIDFGFILSSVKEIVNAARDKSKISYIVGNTFLAKTVLSFLSLFVLIIMIFFIDILKINILFVVLSFIAIYMSAYFGDFFFRGIEKMQFITIIYVVSKGLSTILVFILVKGNNDIIWIPVLDIISNAIAAGISIFLMYHMGYCVKFGNLRVVFRMIKDSFVYFLSSVATTAFSALNTLLIGIVITDLTMVSYWSICLSIISAIQGLYAPICNSIYPTMIEKKRISIIHKAMFIFMPIITVGCIACFFCARFGLFIVGGEKYVDAEIIFKYMIPILFFSFPAQLYGWPTLGAIGKVKITTISTIITALFQVFGLFVLILIGKFTLINLAILRSMTEMLLCIIRMGCTYKNKKSFYDVYNIKEEGI